MDKNLKKFLNVQSLSKQYKNYCINKNAFNDRERYLCFNSCKPLLNDLKNMEVDFLTEDNFVIIDLFNLF